MKITFYHDAKLVRFDNTIYGNLFNYKTWKRYLKVFDSMIISTRIKDVDTRPKDLEKSNGKNINIMPIESYNENIDIILKNKNIRSEIRQSLEKSDGAIIRLPSFIGQIASEEAKKMGKPYLVEVVGCSFDALWNHSWKGKVLALPRYRAMKKAVADAPYVVYVTNNYLQTKYPTTGKHTNCSNVSLSKFDDKILDERLNKTKNMSKNNKIIIGTTGAINIKYKGQEYVIKALAKLKEQGITKFEYQLVGGGDSKYLYNIAKKYNVLDQVNFLGAKPHSEVIQWLDKIDIYIQPSLTEGLPRAVIEAMSRALPIIGSNAGGIPELLDKKAIFNKKSVSELFNILSMIDSDFLKKQAERNFIESKKYDKQIIERRRVEFFNKFKNEIIER